jgi:ElaB/YqjD/DUF883 family membrane-anchored ribosome-binding protein
MEANTATSNDKITEALKLLESTAKEKKDELRNLVVDKYAHLKDTFIDAEGSVKHHLDSVRKKATDAAEHARDISEEKAREIARTVDENVHKNPWPYLGGVAVGALLLGFVLGKK